MTISCEQCHVEMEDEMVFKIETCKHAFCYECVRNFMLTWHTLMCPKYPHCPGKITKDQIQLLLAPDELEDCIADLLAQVDEFEDQTEQQNVAEEEPVTEPEQIITVSPLTTDEIETRPAVRLAWGDSNKCQAGNSPGREFS